MTQESKDVDPLSPQSGSTALPSSPNVVSSSIALHPLLHLMLGVRRGALESQGRLFWDGGLRAPTALGSQRRCIRWVKRAVRGRNSIRNAPSSSCACTFGTDRHSHRIAHEHRGVMLRPSAVAPT